MKNKPYFRTLASVERKKDKKILIFEKIMFFTSLFFPPTLHQLIMSDNLDYKSYRKNPK